MSEFFLHLSSETPAGSRQEKWPISVSAESPDKQIRAYGTTCFLFFSEAQTNAMLYNLTLQTGLSNVHTLAISNSPLRVAMVTFGGTLHIWEHVTDISWEKATVRDAPGDITEIEWHLGEDGWVLRIESETQEQPTILRRSGQSAPMSIQYAA